jgi:hypothetical protein
VDEYERLDDLLGRSILAVAVTNAEVGRPLARQNEKVTIVSHHHSALIASELQVSGVRGVMRPDL